MHAFSFREKHGVRWFCHFRHPNEIKVEFYWWSRSCHASIDVSDEDWTLALAFPPFSLYLSLAGFGLWKPKEKHIFTWDHNREVWLTDQRECQLAIHDWTIRFVLWGRSMEWRAVDPWWIRGISLNLPDLVLGPHRHVLMTDREGIPVQIPMPEGVYHGTAKFERRTWKRPRWRAKTRLFTSVDVPNGGIPHAGKGENSWDCGDDGLCGWSVEGHALERAIAHGVETVLVARRRYGMPSDESMRAAGA